MYSWFSWHRMLNVCEVSQTSRSVQVKEMGCYTELKKYHSRSKISTPLTERYTPRKRENRVRLHWSHREWERERERVCVCVCVCVRVYARVRVCVHAYLNVCLRQHSDNKELELSNLFITLFQSKGYTFLYEQQIRDMQSTLMYSLLHTHSLYSFLHMYFAHKLSYPFPYTVSALIFQPIFNFYGVFKGLLTEQVHAT